MPCPGIHHFLQAPASRLPAQPPRVRQLALYLFAPATLIDDFKLSKEKKKKRPVCSCTCTCCPSYVCVHVHASRCVHACVYIQVV